EAKVDELNTAGENAYRAGKYPEAIKAIEEALEVSRVLYPRDAFPDGHTKIAQSLNNLALPYQSQRKYAAAELLFKDALEMNRGLLRGDHRHVAQSLDNLAQLYWSQGKYPEAEPLAKAALEMRQQLFKGDHPYVAQSLDNLGLVYQSQRKYAEAELLFK